ncbi:hypothetical protein YPPY13_2879, partial [Yersinia pestis PY-13]
MCIAQGHQQYRGLVTSGMGQTLWH